MARVVEVEANQVAIDTIKAFLASQKTGKIQLNIKDGKILELEVTSKVRTAA